MMRSVLMPAVLMAIGGVTRAQLRKLHVLCLVFTVASSATAAEQGRSFDPQTLLARARAAFTAADRDGDQQVTPDEFADSYQAEDREERRRRFKEFDFNGDGKLARGEFLQLLSPADERGEIRDPIAELQGRALVRWRAIFVAVGGGNAVTRENWTAEQIAQRLPALAEVTFDQWDRNRDGEVDDAEGQWLLGIAYGLTLPDGRSIRTPTGRVFSWAYFRILDQDQDGTLSRAEFITAQSEDLFKQLDANRDGRLTVEETWNFLWHDTLSTFFTLDGGFDGYMTTDDFLGVGWGAGVARKTVRAFDEDGDAKISFAEFRKTTFANYASEWVKPRHDIDHDGRLSFQEFYLEKSPVLIAQSRYFFDHFDLDRDGFLSATEFDFEAGFARGDTDRDGQLTLEEFLALFPEDERAEQMRRFLVFDFNGNGKLDAEEYRTLESPVDERGKVADPMAEFADAALAKWETILAAADHDRDLALSTAEWPAKQIAAELSELADAPFVLWDHDSDGKVDRADARWLVDVAYGLAELDGRPLRTPTGREFARYFFRRHDADRNDLLARNEFMAGYHPPNVNTAELFAKLDTDGDGQLTQQETWPVFCNDTVSAFFSYDRNRDGYLTADEIRAIGWGRYLARRTVPAFDDNGDRKLSFREFRLTNFVNQASDWWSLKDLDDDGRISWQEFYREKPPLLIAQSRFYFGRYDRNHDGFLSALEFPSESDPRHGQILANADLLERVLPLEVEFAKHLGRLTNDDAAALESEGYLAIERLIEKSSTAVGTNQTLPAAAGLAGGFGTGVPVRTGVDPAMMRAPHLLLRRELTEAIRRRLAKAGNAPNGTVTAKKLKETLDAERLQAEKRRKHAAVLEYVALLDETVLLTAGQRDDLLDVLSGEASDAWWQPFNGLGLLNTQVQQIFGLLSNSGYYRLGVPEVELAKHLTARQLAFLKDLQQPQDQEVFYAQQAAARPAGAAPAAVAPLAQLGNVAPGPGAAPAAAARPAQRAVARQINQARGQLRFLRQQPTVNSQERRLVSYIELRLDDIHAACGLSDSLRAKLFLAAKLDLTRLREQLASQPPDKLNEGEELVVQKVQMRAWPAPLPLQTFMRPDSHFQKTVHGKLIDDQQTKLAAADARRRALQRQALVEAVVAGFERAAALTSSQCDVLAKLLNDTIADVDAESSDDWRIECLRQMAQLPFERLKPMLFDFQEAGALHQHAQLIESARHLENLRANSVRAAVPSA